MNEQMIRKNNMKLYPIYKMFAWDLLFHYAIFFLFLTQVKGFSAYQVLLADSSYAFFSVLFQIPCINIVDRLGKKNSLLLGNLFASISILLLTLGNSFSLLIFLHLIQAIGYNLKAICEPTILSDSIPQSSSSSKIYSKLDGKGTSFFYMFDAFSCFITGFLYVINPYIPMVLCLLCCLFSTIISLAFVEPHSNSIDTKKTKFIVYYKDLLETFKKISKSSRLKSLLIFALCFWANLAVFRTLRSSLLVDVGIPEQYFGVILAITQIISSMSAKKHYWFHNKFKNKTLSFLAVSIVFAFIFVGLIVSCNISSIVSILATMVTIVIVAIVNGPYFTLIQKYLNSFSNPNVNTKIFAIKYLLENLGRVILSLFASLLLSITTTSYTLIIIGSIFFIIFIILLNYMKTKVGLKPEEYPAEDLIFSNEK